MWRGIGDRGSIFAFFKIEYRTADYFYISRSDSVGTNKIMITEMCKTVVGIECVSRSGVIRSHSQGTGSCWTSRRA